ncbi:BTAD domain-containing putative transcriptional regulator [Streptomyces argenteolus]|uniref:BTAD domain-containing putative transcriptional regulator n=1 Tax=Streptomyces argenteolus TaxID=67274 RepID=A0ABW6X8I4_9ACTN
MAVRDEFDFELLGPLVVRRAGAVLDPGRRRQRLLVIRLLLADGRTVASDSLCEELWPQQPGGGATASLHAHVSKLRAVLEPRHLRGRGSFGVLVTEPGGYALRVPAESRDTVRFELAMVSANRLLDQGRPAETVREAERALRMWRGAALADAAHHLFAAPETARLEELRQTTQEIRTSALLLSGRTPQAITAAQELTAQNPLRESGWALLLRALYLAGRHPEALRRYADLRRHLADELGLEPGPQLRALHDGILRHDLPPLLLPGTAGAGAPVTTGAAAGGRAGFGDTAGSGERVRPTGGRAQEGLDETVRLGTRPVTAAREDVPCGPLAEATPAETRAGSTAPTAKDAPPGEGSGGVPAPTAPPMQLPGDLPVFTGRTTESACLSAVRGAPGRPGPAGAPVVVIGGAPGVGKTAFAVHHAHQIAASFPDGQLFVDLCGFHPHAPAVEPGDALHGFLTALGVPALRIPENTADRSTMLRSLLADRRVLLVLDNARDEQQVRPLLPAGTGCLTLITSRNLLAGLIATDGAKPFILPMPSPAEAHEALARRLGAQRLATEPAAAAEIVELCGRLPLALAVVAARAELDPAFPLHAIADDLRDAHGGLDAFTGFDTATDVRAVFSWSYRSLDESAARLFRLLALHPGPRISAPAAADLAGLPLPQTRRLLDRLTRACLVEQPRPGQFTLHDLLRVYAGELTHAHDDADERDAATCRVLDHYMFTAHEADRLLKQDTLPHLDLGPARAGGTPQVLTDAEAANRWLSTEREVLTRLLHTAVDQRRDRHITGLAWALKEHLSRQEFWPEAITAITPALEAARRRGDRLQEGRCHRSLGGLHGYLGHQEQALGHLESAARLFQEIGSLGEQARTQHGMGVVLHQFGRLREALVPAGRALALARAARDDVWTAECLNGLAWLHSSLGRPEQGLVHGEEAIALFQGLNAPWREAICWDSLGYTLHLLGRYEEAVATYQRALDVFEDLGDHRNAVGSLMRLGDTCLAMGDREAARAHWVRALADAEQQALCHSTQQVRQRLTGLDTEAGPSPVASEKAGREPSGPGAEKR